MMVLSPFLTRGTGEFGNLVNCDLDTDRLCSRLGLSDCSMLVLLP